MINVFNNKKVNLNKHLKARLTILLLTALLTSSLVWLYVNSAPSKVVDINKVETDY